MTLHFHRPHPPDSVKPVLVFLLMVMLSAAFFWPGSSFIPSTDRDESRYVEASRQMAATNDWVDIHFQDETRYRKPVGIYWAQAAAVKLFGENPLNPVSVYRWPSLIGAAIAVIATYTLATAMGGAMAGLVATFLLASTLLLNVEARLATPDALLMAAITVAYAALHRLGVAQCPQEGPEKRAPLAAVIVFWAAIGVGILLKGPLIVLMLGLSILTLKLVERDRKWLRATRPAIGIWIALAIALPWFIAIYLRSGFAFFNDALGHDFAGKLTQGQENHFAPPGVYLLLLPLTFWPGSLLAMAALPFAWKSRRAPGMHFLLAWLVPNWIAMELVPTKLPHYVLPLFPALAIITAASLTAGYKPDRLTRIITITLFVIATALLGVVLGFSATRLGVNMDYASLPIHSFAIAAGAFVIAIAIAMYVASLHDDQRVVIMATLATVLVYGTAFGIIMPSMEQPFLSRAIAQHRAALPAALAHGVVTLVGYHEPSAVVWLGEKTMLFKPYDAAAALEDGGATLAIVADKDDAEFREDVKDLGFDVKLVDHVDGYNYSRGKKLTLNFYSRAP